MIDNKRHAKIKAALGLRGISLSDIARELSVTPSTVSIVSKGHRRSRRVEEAIANALGQSPNRIWPERYRNKEAQMSD